MFGSFTLLYTWLTPCREDIPPSSAIQEIPCIWCNLSVHYFAQRSPPFVLIVIQINQILAMPSCLTSILILSSHLHLSLAGGLIFCKFSHESPVYISLLSCMCYMLHPSNSSGMITQIVRVFEEQYKSWSSSVCKFLQPAVTCPLSGQMSSSASCSSWTPSAWCSSLNMTHLVPHANIKKQNYSSVNCIIYISG